MASMNITARVIPQFPARVVGVSGINVDKTGGVFYIGTDFDQFSNTPGAILFRDEDVWKALLPGPLNTVLTRTQSPSGIAWEAPAAGALLTLTDDKYEYVSGVWTKPPGCRFVRGTGVGAGGGGGGCDFSDPPAGKQGAGGGGAGGGYSRSALIDVSAIASIPFTIGAGGIGGVGGTVGGTGGDTQFGTAGLYLNARGGAGGQQGNHTTGTSGRYGGVAGVGQNGALNTGGNGGGNGYATDGVPFGGAGGGSYFGGGARTGSTSGTLNGTDASNYGGGGSGGGNGTVATGPANGGKGSNGVLIIEEFY